MKDYIILVSKANDIIEVDNIISDVTAKFLDKYAKEVTPAPDAKTGLLGKWITDATTYFRDQILACRRELISSIPENIRYSEACQKLTSQYL